MHGEAISQLAREFQSAQPYGYAEVGTLFDRAELARVEASVAAHVESMPRERDMYGSFRKYRLSKLADMPEAARAFVTYLNSRPFISVLESISGITGLRADPDLFGGGVHVIGAGGYLKLHTDFNWHRKLQLHRRLNLLVYLNSGWRDDWRGAIELWDGTAAHKVAEFPPRLGTALLFATSDRSYHGHPDPLGCPEDVFRKSIAMYYYSATRPADETIYGESEMTSYAARPDETFPFQRAQYRADRAKLALKRLWHTVSASRKR